MDYQNVHLVGHDTFADPGQQPHETLVDPLKFATELLRVRNCAQSSEAHHAALRRVLVYRGLPSPEHDPDDNRRSLEQKNHWERDSRIEVHLRSLRYRVERGADDKPIKDVHGNSIVIEKREKGVDVLCALALVRESLRSDNKIVILASRDSDLEPAIDEARSIGSSKIEAIRWRVKDKFVYSVKARPKIWKTTLPKSSFVASRDLTPYF